MGGKARIQKDHHIDTTFYNDKKNFKSLMLSFTKKIGGIYKIGFKENNIFYHII